MTSRFKMPLEYEILNLQQMQHRIGWEEGKRVGLQWAIEVLRVANFANASEFLESLVYGKASRGIKQATRFQPSQHPAGNQATKVETPSTAVQWPSQKPTSGNASNNGPP